MIITAITCEWILRDVPSISGGEQYPVVKWPYQSQTNDGLLEKYRNNLQRV